MLIEVELIKKVLCPKHNGKMILLEDCQKCKSFKRILRDTKGVEHASCGLK